jgi:DNA replication protein DnaC
MEQLYALINERYESQRSIMVTTNLPHEELEDQVGQRTISRLTQVCDEVPLYGTDRRYGQAA